MIWQTSRRAIPLEKPLVMAILNVTPDSFSDGGKFFSTEEALKHAEKLILDGADILDIGGESTRPAATGVSADEEISRVVPVIEAISKRFDIPVSIDTSKSEVAESAVQAGAEIINDVSGLRFDAQIGAVAAKYKTALVLMHLRGTFETMHRQAPVEDILAEVSRGFRESLTRAKSFGVEESRIALDVGTGFSKTFEQNLELLAKLDKLAQMFSGFPILVGASRKSFLGKILDDAPSDKRLPGSLASAAIAVWNGARIVRVHDVKETVETLRVAEAIRIWREN
ncbi:MAG TPA: dihydropteroate synthase [Pyrinomonadaceae bacterium]|jgi:dihydropteroate synthase